MRLKIIYLLLLTLTVSGNEKRINLTIIDGQNNHDWVKTTKVIKASLSQTQKFNIKVETAPSKSGKELQQWNPDLSKTDVILLNYNGHSWSKEFNEKFVNYVKNGGGLVLVHAANNAFRNWPEFCEMIGLGWRKEGHGMAVTIDDNTGKCNCEAKGNSGHGSKHAFKVKVRQPQHPIMKGLPAEWLHAKDELYHNMRGPFKNCTILSSAYSDPKQRGTGKHEPITWEVKYGKGRVIVTTMGHVWRGDKSAESLSCIGFQTVLARSCEFAASGKVTIEVPKNFPSVDKTSSLIPPNSELTWQEKKLANPYCMLSPSEAAQAMTVEDGYIVEAVASEPLVEEPVLVVWDGNSAMYVAEMRSYMQDSRGTGTQTLKNGRVKRLVDTDGDGIMDKATVFIDKLNMPRMLLPLDGRLAVVETWSTDIHSYEDTNGDGKADKKELLYKGKRKIAANRSVEHQSSGLIWNTDNYIYTTRERYRFRFTNGKWIDEECSSEDWMQWGLDHDDEGQLFYSANSEPVKGIQQHPVYWKLSRERAQKGWRRPQIGPDYQPEFMIMNSTCEYGDRGESHAYQSFTSACGQTLFRGHRFPQNVYGNYFIGDPTGHVIRRAEVKNLNGRLELINPRPGKEFIVSSDINFRPVNSATGPDGCFYIVDMARGIIQDAPWVNENAAKFMDKSGLSKNKMNGRIWRVRHKDFKPDNTPKMLDDSTEKLISYLSHENGWWRDTSQKLIILRKDRESVVNKLKKAVKSSSNPLARMHALWTLEGMNKADPETIIHALSEEDQRVLRAALKIAEPFIKQNHTEILQKLKESQLIANPKTARQLMLSIGWLNTAEAFELIEKAISKHLTDEGIFLSAMTVLYNQKTPLIQKMLSGTAFESISDPVERAKVRRRWLGGIKAWTSASVSNVKLPQEHVDLIAQGEQIYNQICFTCHGKDGKGVTPHGAELALAPSLVQTGRVTGQPQRLSRILLHGLTGPVDGKHYEAGVMVSASALGYGSDKQIAAVLSYIRQSWGNQASVIEPDVVKEARQKSSSRQKNWTLEELEDYSLPEIKDRSKWQATSNVGSANIMRVIRQKGKCDNQNKPGSWFAIDLGEEYTISRVLLNSKNPDRYPRGWEIRASNDGKSWSDPIAAGNGLGSLTSIDFEPVKARHFKVIQTGLSKHHRWAIEELKVFGKK